jgi:type IV pilus assembly protein PilC
MPTYLWKGKSVSGENQSGELSYETQEEALAYLRKKRVLITSILEKPKDVKFKMPGGGSVSIKELAIFTRQFATMIGAGLPLVQCLEILSKQTDNPTLRVVITQVMHDVESGSTLAESLTKHKKVFDDLFVNMVQAGEAGGVLDEILLRLATYIEKANALIRKVKGALTYPVVVLTVAMGASIFMLMFIIPTFAKLFTDFGGELPLPTKIVMGLSNFLRGFWWALAAIAIAISVAFKRYYATSNGQLVIDRLMLKMPILGDVILKGGVARFTRTLGTLIASGVPILTGLDITSRTAGNKVLQLAIEATRNSIREGETIAAPLRASGVFPPMVVQMIAVGEQTGALDQMLNKIAVFYEEEVDAAVETLTSVIEPVMIVVMGTIVGGMLIAMYLPMFKLINVVAGK